MAPIKPNKKGHTMKIKKWPFWPVFAMFSLIAVVVVVEVRGQATDGRCVADAPACGAPTVSLNKLFLL